MTYEFKITVRGYELDSFGHVNNAVYLNYCEQARWEILREKKSFDHSLANSLTLVVTGAEIRYVNEAKVFDELVILTDVNRSAPYLVFNHIIRRPSTNEMIAKAIIKTILVDNDRIPHDIPQSFCE